MLTGADAPPTARAIRVVRTRAELREGLSTARRPIGLVPTMGWLHAGHRALIERAQAENATTVVSIFVNPKQFGDPADLARYPRNEARDVEICAESGADLVFAPNVQEVYPPGFDTTVRAGAIAEPLEGAARPGHFDGVATVVAILFNLVGAERAYFGQKDAQQLLVIRHMARDLAIPTEVIAHPTVREPDGLALSSRNVHLSAEERAAAPILRKALLAARAAWEGGERSGDSLRHAMGKVIAQEPLASPDYVSAADAGTLREVDRVDGPALLSLAVRFGSTRLIDNELLP
ncbi:MAG TPA: pantoate--beta-alanine ligase [Candidatus Limnocylindrales bacterium]|nr:pantoate--beta-alanine ligase [Candidatus Limnocylindrales bacterium]